jgi:hypothetical protein
MQRDRKLTQEQVAAIRENPLPANHIAKYFGVSARTIQSVRNQTVYRETINDKDT